MSRKNFKVATTEDGKTTITKIDKAPTGKIKTIKDKEQVRKEREEQYKNFRVNALKRRAKRMGLTDEQTEVKVKELLNQLDTPNSYNVLILFSKKDKDLVKQALLKEELVWKVMSDSHLIMLADQDTLKTIREIMPPSAKIHPYCIKKAAILPVQEPKKKAKKPMTHAEKKAKAKAAKKARKVANIEAVKNRKGNAAKQYAKMRKQIRLLKAKKIRKTTTVQLKAKKASTAPKKASTTLKQAA